MAQVYVSPGVYARERDYSFYVRGISESSLGLVGITKKGPANRPVLVSNLSEYEAIFGKSDGESLTAYYAKSYFKYGGGAYVVRVLGDEQIYNDSLTIVHFPISGTVGSSDETFTIATLISTATTFTSSIVSITPSANISDDHNLTITGIYTGTVNFVNTNASNYIKNIFPAGTIGATPVCIAAFPNTASYYEDKGFSLSGGVFGYDVSSSPYDVSGYTNAKTPVIVSDRNNGSIVSLFTIHCISDGVSSNSEIKIAIENIDQTNRTFDVVVRDFSDTNSNQTVLERYSKCNLDPSSTSYIEYKIGDSRDESGDYPLNSNYIYVSVESGVREGLYANRIPVGFSTSIVPGSARTNDPNFPTVSAYTSSVSTANQYYGVNYSSCDPEIFGTTYNQWDIDASVSVTRYGFILDSGYTGASYVTGDKVLSAYTTGEAKFLVPVVGGRDGWTLAYRSGGAISGRTQGKPLFFTNTPDTNLYNQFKTAIDTLANPEEYDINLMAVAGINIASTIGQYAISICETRADCFYIGDIQSGLSTVSAAVNAVSSLDTNYAATYYPWVKKFDANSNKYINMPATPNVLESMAYTDVNAYPWYAPAGMNRGILTDIIKPLQKLSVSDRDTLYEGRVNPIASFPGQGYSIWGQRTLQTRDTALDRINVRRMLIYARKLIAGVTQYLVFEQNNERTWTTFKNLVNPILDNIKNNNGVYDFRVIMDETTNTPDVIDRNQMIGQIYLQPTKTAEVIILNFNIMPSGAIFEE